MRWAVSSSLDLGPQYTIHLKLSVCSMLARETQQNGRYLGAGCSADHGVRVINLPARRRRLREGRRLPRLRRVRQRVPAARLR